MSKYQAFVNFTNIKCKEMSHLQQNMECGTISIKEIPKEQFIGDEGLTISLDYEYEY